MLTAALIGPDGAGKTTIIAALPDVLDVPVKSIYMGVSLESSGLMLPTTRLVRALRRARGVDGERTDAARPNQARSNERAVASRTAAGVRAALRLANWLGEEWLRQLVAWHYKRKGNLVLFDRHFFFDYYLHDVVRDGADPPLTRKIHGFLLQHLYPKPDLVVCLDAPVDVLLARKPEETVESLERRRQEYRDVRSLLGGESLVVVDTNRPLEEVTSEVAAVIREAYEARVRAAAIPGRRDRGRG
jgi:thymidylate kinase